MFSPIIALIGTNSFYVAGSISYTLHESGIKLIFDMTSLMFLGPSLGIIPDKCTESNSDGKGPTGITVDKSVEFSFEELSRATDSFSLANKIGQGGFGAVYYAELRGEKAAIKKMDRQASKEFIAELNVLTCTCTSHESGNELLFPKDDMYMKLASRSN